MRSIHHFPFLHLLTSKAPETIIDIASLKVETQIQQGESIVTATFPAKKKPVHQEQDERVMYVENRYDEFEHDELEPADEEQEYYYSDNEEYQWDIYSEAGSMDDGDVEFNTVIEWVSHPDPELARFALPPRPEGMEGTLCLPLEEKVEGEKLLRVRFFGPTKDIEVRDYDESQGEEENWDGTWLREDEEEELEV